MMEATLTEPKRTLYREVALGECCQVTSGSTPKRNRPEFWDGTIHWFTPKDLSNLTGKFVDEAPELITLEGFKSCSTTMLPPESLLLTSRAPIGHVAINKREVCTNQGFKSLIPGKGVDVNYLYYVIKKLVPQLKDLGNGATFKELSKTTLEKVKIPLPPLATQKKIAAILDAADEHRQKTKALLEKYDELAQSIFLEMFGDPVSNEKGWERKTLKEVCDKITDGTHHSPEPQDQGFPYVTAKHVKPYGLDFERSPTYVNEKAHNEIFKRCSPEYGDVLYIKDGATTGIACINSFNEPISMLSSLALLKVNKDKLSNRYLCFWLNNKGIKNKLISQYMSGAAIRRYTLKKINSFEIMLPPVGQQEIFAKQIEHIESHKTELKKSVGKSQDLFNSLLQRAFKGELV